MGGRHQIRPAKVFQAVTEELSNPILKHQPGRTPPWYNIMQSIPPSETLVRIPIPKKTAHTKARKPRNLFRPQKIVYLEDRLRDTFYRDHPWELARPRVILESDGKDYQRCDWSKGLRQPGTPLTGECVVQRQLWLIENQGMEARKAYDVTRREFYRLRQEEEIEKRIALEEAKHVGAYFGKSRIDVSHILEDKEFENWKVWAAKETERMEARKNAAIDDFNVEEESSEIDEIEATEALETEGAAAPAAARA